MTAVEPKRFAVSEQCSGMLVAEFRFAATTITQGGLMLVLTRKIGERILIGQDIYVTVVSVNGQRVRLGIEAPDAIDIRRRELWLEFEEKPGRLPAPC
jgi:carbon storage regulator